MIYKLIKNYKLHEIRKYYKKELKTTHGIKRK